MEDFCVRNTKPGAGSGSFRPEFFFMEVYKMKKVKEPGSVPYTGLGLIFGTALGAALCMILSLNILWAGVGTAAGLILGAAINNR